MSKLTKFYWYKYCGAIAALASASVVVSYLANAQKEQLIFQAFVAGLWLNEWVRVRLRGMP
jgi:hypothetical protein